MPGLFVRPTDLDLYAVRGDALAVTLTFYSDTALTTEVDLSGRTITATISATAGGSQVTSATMTVGTTDAATGVITLSMTAAATALLTGSRYHWWLRDDTHDQTIFDGTVEVGTKGAAGVRVAAGTSADVTVHLSTSTTVVATLMAPGGGAPSGGAGGFLSGTYPDPGVNTEALQDAVGAMVAGNTESGGTLTYDDTNGKIDLTVTPVLPDFVTTFFYVINGTLDLETAALGTAAGLNPDYYVYAFNGTDTPAIAKNTGSGTSELVAIDPEVNEVYFSRLLVTYDVGAATATTDNTPRLWFVGGDAGIVQPHCTRIGGWTQAVTDGAVTVNPNGTVIVNASGATTITFANNYDTSGVTVGYTGVLEFWIHRVDSDAGQTVTFDGVIDGVTDPTIAPGESWHVKSDGTELRRVSVATAGDVGLGNVDNTSDANKPVSTAQQTALDGKLATTGGGKDTVSALGSMSGTVTVDLANGNSFYGTLSDNVTSWTLSGATNGKECEAIIEITQHASSAKTVAYPSSWKWAGGVDHVMSTGLGATDVIVVRTRDGGTTVHAAVMGKAFA